MKKSKMRKLFGWVLVLVLALIVGVGVGAQNAGATPPIKNTITILEDGSRVPTSRVNDSATNTNNTGTGSSNSSLRETVSVPKATPVTDTEEEDSDEFVLSSKDDYKCDDIADRIKDGKAGALEWIMCPAMDNTRYTATYLDEKIQNWLEMDSSLYSNSSIRNVWGFIRDIANVVMVAFFLLVVASQVTGYGIDNYGIKKMLPRLIAMAIIVNLSLYICQIAVDISNILGTGFRDLFSSAAQGMAGEEVGGGSFFGSAILGMFASAGGVASGVATVTTVAELAGISVAGFWAILVVVLILLLVVLVAAAILLGAVGIRKILVLFCIIISPLAFVMFIFPNMQNLTKKWWSLFKTALIIYPICGLVAGISAFLIYMARGSNPLHWWEIGLVMVLPYLVYFMIPTLVKEALSGLGKIGGALTSMGSAVKSGGKALGGAAMRGASKTQWGQDNLQRAKLKADQNRNRHLERKYGGGGVYRFGKKKGEAKEDITQKAAAAQKAAEEAKAPGSEASKFQQRRLDRKAQVLANEARIYTDSKAAENARIQAEQSAIAGGVVPLSTQVAMSRAMAAREAQELKGYTDQYSNYTRTQMGDELRAAVEEYDNNRSDANALRLQAAIATAESRGMNQEMLNIVGGSKKDAQGNTVPSLRLSANNANDAKILSRLSSSNNKVISQYGIQMGKPANVGQSLSMGEFAASTGPVKLSEAFANKGPNILNGMDDDTLEYINKSGAAAPVVSGAMLANAAASTTNQKELRQINDMFTKTNADDISFSGKQLANFDNSTIKTLMNGIQPNSNLQKTFIAATNDIANSPELMGSLRPEQRKLFDAVRKEAGQNAVFTTD